MSFETGATTGSTTADGTPTGPAPKRRRVTTVVRRLYVVALIAVVAWVLVTRADDVRDVAARGRPGLLLVCLVASFGQLALTSATWSSGLRALGAPVPWRTSLRATAGAAPARYLPGGVWYAVGRAAALQRTGVPVRALAAVATLEMLLVPVVGFAVGTTVLAATGSGVGTVPPLLPLAVAVPLLLVASPPSVNAVLRLRTGDHAPLRVTWPALGRFLAWTAAFWCWAAGVFAVYVAAFPAATGSGSLTVAGAYMVAWGVGWLAVFSPQGVGVFEVTMSALLAGGGAGLAVLLAGYRAIILVRDLAAGALAGLAGRRAPPA